MTERNSPRVWPSDSSQTLRAIFARNLPVLEALGRRCRLGIVSNFYGNLEAVCASVGLAPLFGVMADSDRVGAKKPDPKLFRFALRCA